MRVTPNEVVSKSVQFTDDDGDPVYDIVAPVKYFVYSPDGKKVLSGSATVDPQDASFYTLNFTIPANMPYTEGGEFARLKIRGKDYYDNSYVIEERFEVLEAGDENAVSTNKNVVTTVTSPLTASTEIPASLGNTTATFQVLNEQNQVVHNAPVTSVVKNGRRIFTANSVSHGLQPSSNVHGAYLGQWVITGGSLTGPEIETCMVYVLNAQAMLMMESLRSLLDKGWLANIHPYLSWDAASFIQYLNKGFDVINSMAPRTTTFSMNAPLPIGLTVYIETAAAVQALRAQQLAESNSSFDFQGLGVQLNVDRFPALDSIISQLTSDLDRAAEAKKAWVNSGSPTGPVTPGGTDRMKSPIVSAITLGPNTNYAQIDIMDSAIVPWGFTPSTITRRRMR